MDHSSTSNHGDKPVLIFPGGMPRSLEYLQHCLQNGTPVIGASSLDYDVSREQYPAWLHLPYITQPEFDESLRQAILKHGISGVYSPNAVVWGYLSRKLDEIAPGTILVNSSPVSTELSGYHAALSWAHAQLAHPLPLASSLQPQPALSEIELASLFRHAAQIPGMCDHEKFCALYEIARRAPSGDVVEIGSWWGKSAFILAGLSKCYNIGNLLCVDPWSNEHLVQHDDLGLVDSELIHIDADEALAVFEMNLIPYSNNRINYLRLPSIDGAKHYRTHRTTTTPRFGTTTYCGDIAILHIDGNHNEKSAKADMEAWAGMVTEGGWIIMDDYVWPYGDGPQKAGNEFLNAFSSKICSSFVMGSALFIQLSSCQID